VKLTRRHFLQSSSIALGAVGFGPMTAFAQTPQPGAAPAAPPVTKFEDLRRGVGFFSGSGGSIGYLITNDGAIAVDSQFMNTAEICVAGLKQKAPKGIELLINTHHHGDHTGGNAAFKPVVKRIVAHENCLTWHKKVAEQAAAAPNAAPQAFADTTFKDMWKVDFGGETVHARYMGPGHTSGDAVIFFEKANVIHGGDLLFRRVHPRVDGPAGASVVNWISILDKLASTHGGDTIYIFGHGKDNMTRGTVSDVKYFRDYLSAAVSHARKAAAAGQSKEEAAKVASLPGFDDVAALNPRISLAGVIEAAYDEIAKK
jgi:cyclase